MRIISGARIVNALVVVVTFVPLFAAAYGQSAYYDQGTYYSQAYYEGTYYSQSYYQSYYQSSYYSQAYYQSYYQGTYYSQAYYQAYYQSYYQSYYQTGYTFITESSTVTGNAVIVGSISKGSGTFVIDHPLDPLNKLLYYSFVESPEVKNFYDGIADLDEKGRVTVELPDYFFALNERFRFQATPLGAPMPDLYLSQEVRRKYFGIAGPITFSLAGGVAGGRVSWQVTGVRRDPFIQEFPIIPEVEKGDDTIVKQGECIFEPLCE